MKNKNVFLGSIIFCSVFFTDFTFAKCLSNPNQIPECRYQEGDSWCAERSSETPYAYTDKCLAEKSRPSIKTQETSTNKIKTKMITVFGVNIGMNKKETYSVLEGRGYVCNESVENFWDKELSAQNRKIREALPDASLTEFFDWKVTRCNKAGRNKFIDEITILFSDKENLLEAYFNCDVFNTCKLTKNEAAQLLVNSTSVSSMSHSAIKVISGTVLQREHALCGTGPSQDKVCIFGTNSVIISRGNYGSKNPSYR